jgi:hypothetical protein
MLPLFSNQMPDISFLEGRKIEYVIQNFEFQEYFRERIAPIYTLANTQKINLNKSSH